MINNNPYTSFILILLASAYFLSGCVNYFEPFKTEPATLGTVTETSEDLKSLPKPKEKIVAAVYKFRDQTGQYKPTITGASWSTAVTQGATSILLKALEESEWFLPIEREGLSNLLNERKIIRSSRANYEEENTEDSQLLPPLLFAGVILEGGIISYDSNIMTGGTGIKYFGAGASGQYRQDRVTIYLRAISTSNGQILKTVYTSKTILSQLIDIGFIRFVEFKKLLEVETGYSYNEPPELCVTQAIEKAVHSLIIEGVIDGLWSLEHPEDINSKPIKDYLTEKEENTSFDEFGYEKITPRTLAIGINSGGQNYQGDYGGGKTEPLYEFFITNPVSENFDLGIRLGTGNLSATNFFKAKTTYAGINGKFYMLPHNRFSPYISGGIDATYMKGEDRKGNDIQFENDWAANLSIGIGAEYRFWDKLGINGVFDYNYLLSDEIDGRTVGDINDYFYAFRFGISFYPGF
jgi:curli production assembly/transport component CsgG